MPCEYFLLIRRQRRPCLLAIDDGLSLAGQHAGRGSAILDFQKLERFRSGATMCISISCFTVVCICLLIFSARCRAYATMSVSVCLSVCLWRLCIVITRCNGSRISLHAWIDGCICYLLTTPHTDRRMGWCRNFWWKRGGVISRYASHC